MHLIAIRKSYRNSENGRTLVFRLADGRIAASYESGYCRITAKWRKRPATVADLDNGLATYQMNKVVKIPRTYTMYDGTERTFESNWRLLIENESDRVKFIEQFELKNCVNENLKK